MSTMSEPKVYDIKASALAALKDIIEKANRRLARANVEERFSFTSKPYMKENRGNPGVFIRRTKVTINTPTISYGGYSFLAAIVLEENGFVVRSATGVELGAWTPDEMQCDHCNRRMTRNKTYLIEDATGKRMQVGSSCVRPFLGLTPSGLWTLLFEIDPSVLSDEAGSQGGAEDLRVPMRWIVALSLAVSDMGENYISRKAVQNGYQVNCTADSVKDVLFGRDSSHTQWRDEMNSKTTGIIAEHAATIDAIIDASIVENPSTDYEQNMSVIMSGKYASQRNIGYAVSSVAAYARALHVDTETAPASTGFVADVDAAIRNLSVTVKTIVMSPTVNYMGYDDTKSRVEFTDTEGHAIIWWATRAVTEFSVGDSVTITSAKVKDHSTFRGSDQTVLTRVRVRV